MLLQKCPFGGQCTCHNYQPTEVIVAELRDYMAAQMALTKTPLNVFATGEEIGSDPRQLPNAGDLFCRHFIKFGGAKKFAEQTQRGNTTIVVCRHMVMEERAEARA